MCILMRTPLLSRSSTKLHGSKFAHAHIAILASSYSDDVIAIEVKNRKTLIRFLEFPSVNFLKIWQRSYFLLAFLAFNLSGKFVRQGFCSAKKHSAKSEKTTLITPTFFDYKSFFLPDSTQFEQIRKFCRRKLKKIEIKAKQTSKNGDV